VEAICWEDGCLKLLDQTLLPGKYEYLNCREHKDVAEAIKRLSVRGAPAIGAAAAYGLVLGANCCRATSAGEFVRAVEQAAGELAATRPTAVNLQWALDRMLARLRSEGNQEPAHLRAALLDEAHRIYAGDVQANRRMGAFGLEVVPPGARVLTHCNAGALATAGYGTALGVVRAAHAAGLLERVYADETRPLLQGARLTAWEMIQENIPVTLLTDNMAGYLMACGKVDLVVVGADRIAANGDVANKIGTYGVAVLAREHGLPFYVAAPLSTVDFAAASGKNIPIEERDPREVTHIAGVPLAPEGVEVWNPAFDVTPHHLVTAIITDRGIARPPYVQTLAKLRNKE
jgi:methylthioribose-1-phosphate isomerase